MIGSKKLSTIRTELRAALAAERSNPIRALDRRIRQLTKRAAAAAKPPRSLGLLRDALAQLADEDRPRSKAKSSKRRQKAPSRS